MRRDKQGLHTAGGLDFRGGALLLLADANEAVENHGDQTAEKDQIRHSTELVFDGPEVIVPGGKAGRKPVSVRCKVEQDVDRVRRCREEKWQEHHAGFSTATQPGTEEHDSYQAAEDKLRCQRDVFEGSFEMQHGCKGQEQSNDLPAENQPSRCTARESQNELERRDDE